MINKNEILNNLMTYTFTYPKFTDLLASETWRYRKELFKEGKKNERVRPALVTFFHGLYNHFGRWLSFGECFHYGLNMDYFDGIDDSNHWNHVFCRLFQTYPAITREFDVANKVQSLGNYTVKKLVWNDLNNDIDITVTNDKGEYVNVDVRHDGDTSDYFRGIRKDAKGFKGTVSVCAARLNSGVDLVDMEQIKKILRVLNG